MKRKKSAKKKIAVIIVLLILNSFNFIYSVYATSINSVNLYTIGDCGELLKYKGVVVKVSYIQYSNNGKEYPAYCLDKTKPRSRNGWL